MTRVGWWLVEILAKCLEPCEQDAVLGDFAESREHYSTALCHVLGLIIRRQITLLSDWRPWLAIVGIGGAAGFFLSQFLFRVNVDVGQQLLAYRAYGVNYSTGLTVEQDVVFLLCNLAALLVWSWACAFLLASLSGRAAWLTWPMFYLIVLNSALARFVWSGNIVMRGVRPLPLLLSTLLPISIGGILFIASAAWGAVTGSRKKVLPLGLAKRLMAIAASITVLAVWITIMKDQARANWSEGVLQPVPLLSQIWPFMFVSWPAAYILGMAQRSCSSVKKRGDLSLGE